jgi:membrane protein DedA with SNARE-associated domain
VTHFITHHGLPLLFVVVMLESFGLPLPGETALIAFGVLASQGHYSIAVVIAVAAAAAIIGDNLGYTVARNGGRGLLERWGPVRSYAHKVLPRAEAMMARHGGKTVFFGRFIAVLRFAASWVAGLARMEWRRFLFFNAAGGICWATLVGLVAYYGGDAAASALRRYGVIAAVVIALILVGGFFFTHYLKKWIERRL